MGRWQAPASKWSDQGCRSHRASRETGRICNSSPHARRWKSHGRSDSRETRRPSQRSVPGDRRPSARWTYGRRGARQTWRQVGVEAGGHNQDRSSEREEQENRRGRTGRRNIQCDSRALRHHPGAREADCECSRPHLAPGGGHQARSEGRANGEESGCESSQTRGTRAALRPNARACPGRNVNSTSGRSGGADESADTMEQQKIGTRRHHTAWPVARTPNERWDGSPRNHPHRPVSLIFEFAIWRAARRNQSACSGLMIRAGRRPV